MGTITSVSAGAGSGKTTDICREICREVLPAGRGGRGVDPERLLFTTFTRKAAAELKSRAQQEVLKSSSVPLARRLEIAERLELSLSGTVHSVGHQLLQRYALYLGRSPVVRVLEEDDMAQQRKRLFPLLNSSDLDDFYRLCAELSIGGESYTGGGNKDPADYIHELESVCRSNGIQVKGVVKQLRESLEKMLELLRREQPEVMLTPSFDEFYRMCLEARDELEKIGGPKKAREELIKLAVKRSCVWKDMVLSNKRKEVAGNNNEEIKSTMNQLKSVNDSVWHHPGLEKTLSDFIERLAQLAGDLSDRYDTFKGERGFVDFTDLEKFFLELVRSKDLERLLSADIAASMVDEFQDTNPIQLAIFKGLAKVSERSRWVGDPKQAIYAFRGAAPELARRAWNSPGVIKGDPLNCNYRSMPGLVRLVGELFKGACDVFEDVVQEADREGKGYVERWIVSENGKKDTEAANIASGIKGLLDNKGYRPADIAVLARTNNMADRIARECRELGIPVVRGIAGLLSQREALLVFEALRYLVDRNDGVAAATILQVTGKNPSHARSWLERRLREVSEAGASWPPAPFEGEPILEKLASIGGDLPPSVAVQKVITALDLVSLIGNWSFPVQRAANLDALVSLAEGYEARCEFDGRPATLRGFTRHLEELKDGQKDTLPTAAGLDAVWIDTYHKAKGLEWPVVILTELGGSDKDGLFDKMEAQGGDASSDDPLAGRQIRFWPWPFGGAGNNLKDKIKKYPEVAEIVERQKEEELRLLYVGFTRARERLVLAHSSDKYGWLKMLKSIDKQLPLGGSAKETEDPSLEYTTRKFEFSEDDSEAGENGGAGQGDSSVSWLGPAPAAGESEGFPPRVVNPAEMAPLQRVEHVVETLGDALVPEGLSGREESRELGDALHAFFAALPSLSASDKQAWLDVARRCLEAYGAAGRISPEALVEAGERLSGWAKRRFPSARWHTELHVAGAVKEDSFVSGVADLLLELEDGKVVVVDHKSPFAADPADVASKHAGQLAGYRRALESNGYEVAGTFLHLPLAGKVIGVTC